MNHIQIDWSTGEGSSGNFQRVGYDDQNHRIVAETPFGEEAMVWETKPKKGYRPCGGWYYKNIPVVKGYTYRMSIYVKRVSEAEDQSGKVFFGCDKVSTEEMDGSGNKNPYFFKGELPESNKWYLLVGYVHPEDYAGESSEESGLYDCETGDKLVEFVDFRQKKDAVIQTHRCYFYDSKDLETKHIFWKPGFEKVDGQSISVAQLIRPQVSDQPYPIVTSFHALWAMYLESCNYGWENNFDGKFYTDYVPALQSLLALYQHTNHPYFLEKFTRIADEVIKTTDMNIECQPVDEGRGEETVYGWSIKSGEKYHVCMAHSAAVAMVLAQFYDLVHNVANLGHHYQTRANKYLKSAQKAMAVHLDHWDEKKGYFLDSGNKVNLVTSNSWMGMALIQLQKAENKYGQILDQLTPTIINHCTGGWSTNFGEPVKRANVVTLEDAGPTVEFLAQVADRDYLHDLAETFLKCKKENGYSTYLNGQGREVEQPLALSSYLVLSKYHPNLYRNIYGEYLSREEVESDNYGQRLLKLYAYLIVQEGNPYEDATEDTV